MTEPGAWQRFLKRRVARISLAVVAVVAVAAVIGPLVMPASYGEVSPNQFAPPSLAHPFGTDLNGRDVLHRVLTGGRISLLVGLSGAFISLVVGTSYGLVAGYAGGKWDALMMRIVEVLYAVPRLIIILIFINTFDSTVKNWLLALRLDWLVGYSRIVILVLSLGLIEWLTMARIVRGQVLALSSQQFVAAARALGQSNAKIITRHLLPNLVGIVVIYLTLTIPAVILDEVVPELPRPRDSGPAGKLGLVDERRRAGDQSRAQQLVAACLPGARDVRNPARAQLPRRRAARRARPAGGKVANIRAIAAPLYPITAPRERTTTSAVRARSSSVWASERKPVSNCDGAK